MTCERAARAARRVDERQGAAGRVTVGGVAKGRYGDAVSRQVDERREQDYRAGRLVPYPQRITMALDLCGLYGPEVDHACLAREPAVDQWEAGRAVPSWDQLVALARLTGMPVSFFFVAPTIETGPVIFCGRGGCKVVEPREPTPRFGERSNVVPLFREALF